jgi:hypothetical protein
VSIKNRAMKELLAKMKDSPLPLDPCPAIAPLKSRPKEAEKPIAVVPRRAS